MTEEENIDDLIRLVTDEEIKDLIKAEDEDLTYLEDFCHSGWFFGIQRPFNMLTDLTPEDALDIACNSSDTLLFRIKAKKFNNYREAMERINELKPKIKNWFESKAFPDYTDHWDDYLD